MTTSRIHNAPESNPVGELSDLTHGTILIGMDPNDGTTSTILITDEETLVTLHSSEHPDNVGVQFKLDLEWVKRTPWRYFTGEVRLAAG